MHLLAARIFLTRPTGIVLVAAAALFGEPFQDRKTFDVASVKLRLDDDPYVDVAPRRSGNRVAMHNASLISIVAWAFHLANPKYQLVEHPWEKSLWESYDIEAVASDVQGDDDLRLMFQMLLIDRFKLKVHHEMRELNSYDLVTARSGVKLSVAQPGQRRTLGGGGSSSWVALEGDGRHLVGKGATISELVVILTGQMKAPVRDRTNLSGAFDYDVVFSGGIDGSDAPVLTIAIQELGLRLEKAKGDFEVLVIDHLEKPSQN